VLREYDIYRGRGTQKAMHLSQLEVKGFRGIESISLELREGVNILIGENNTCKTALIDALRLCLGISSERRDLYVQPEDFYIGGDGERADVIELNLTFSNPTQDEMGVYVEMLAISDDGTPQINLHVQFSLIGDRIRRKTWGGANEGQEIPYPVLELFYFTHLGALRDATRDLSPTRANRLSQLFLKLVAAEEDRTKYASSINTLVRGAADWKKLLEGAGTKIRSHLDKMVLKGQPSDVDIEFVDATFKQIAEGLRMYIPRPDPTKGEETEFEKTFPERPRFNISQNSLGYNNLLYIATVLGDLLERRAQEPYAFIALFVEEPEAHLHPHWQNTLFKYIQSIQGKNIQVLVTSHSPTITAKSDIESLVVMTVGQAGLASTPLRNLGLPDLEKRHLQRFLDVTKCQLFFARGVILVEGISEALLMPAFASALGDEFDLDKNAIEVVNIGGVAFEPFALLFNNADSKRRLPVPCSILTDDDRNEGSTISARAEKAQQLKGGMLRVYLAEKTFEYELYKVNPKLVNDTYAAMHPNTDFNNGSREARAAAFVEKIKQNDDKALFAQRLAQSLNATEAAKGFVVPEYIQKALRWAVTGNETASKQQTKDNN
jgi:putative ATP-dependent endonuclease of the OLD family